MTSSEQVELVGWILGSGVFGSLVAWWGSRHRPKVDRTQLIFTGSDALINNLQEERDRLDRRIDEVERKANDRAEAAERVASDAEQRAQDVEDAAKQLAAELGAIRDHHIATIHGIVDGSIPPWLPVPHGQNWISDEDYPHVSIRDHDTGTPGVDTNPPPDDGQPTDIDDTPPGGTS